MRVPRPKQHSAAPACHMACSCGSGTWKSGNGLWLTFSGWFLDLVGPGVIDYPAGVWAGIICAEPAGRPCMQACGCPRAKVHPAVTLRVCFGAGAGRRVHGVLVGWAVPTYTWGRTQRHIWPRPVPPNPIPSRPAPDPSPLPLPPLGRPLSCRTSHHGCLPSCWRSRTWRSPGAHGTQPTDMHACVRVGACMKFTFFCSVLWRSWAWAWSGGAQVCTKHGVEWHAAAMYVCMHACTCVMMLCFA